MTSKVFSAGKGLELMREQERDVDPTGFEVERRHGLARLCHEAVRSPAQLAISPHSPCQRDKSK
jgi:hypothetical protein